LYIKEIAEIHTVLVIDLNKLPTRLSDTLASRHEIKNNTLITYYSEMSPCGDEVTWCESLTQDNLFEYYKEQCKPGKSFASFVEEYELELDVWLLENKVELEGIKYILLNCYW